jgi:hypothetical protein
MLVCARAGLAYYLVGVACELAKVSLYAICIQHMKRPASIQKNYPVALHRGAPRQWVLKPQDLAIALKLVVLGPERLSYAALGKTMHLSQFEAHAAVQRLIVAKLAVSIDGHIRPIKDALRRFVVHGALYTYPPMRGGVTVGMPTAHAIAPLRDLLSGGGDLPPVWPDPIGKVRGQSLLPLYPGLPAAAREDPELYELFALFDALRIGQARERTLAAKLLEERLR